MRAYRPLSLGMAVLRRLRGVPADQRGQAIVEFAFLAPIFIALLAAVLEFSGIMFVQAILEGAAREASRYGITGQLPENVSREEQILAIVEDNTYGIVDMDELQMETLVYDDFGDIGEPSPTRTTTRTACGTTTSRSPTSTATAPGTRTWARPALAARAAWSSTA